MDQATNLNIGPKGKRLLGRTFDAQLAVEIDETKTRQYFDWLWDDIGSFNSFIFYDTVSRKDRPNKINHYLSFLPVQQPMSANMKKQALRTFVLIE